MRIQTILRLHITMMYIERHMGQVGAGDLHYGLRRILGVNARGQATNGVQPENYYCMMPPPPCA